MLNVFYAYMIRNSDAQQIEKLDAILESKSGTGAVTGEKAHRMIMRREA
jgi:hypothetical protein